ncbi:MAG: hypothetical protein ACRETL_07500, partial [Gammaproteobacteria bacterium]
MLRSALRDILRFARPRRFRGRNAFAGRFDPDALHAARISVNDLDVEACRVVQNLTALRQPSSQSNGEASRRVELVFVIGERETRAKLFLKLRNGGASVRFERAVGALKHKSVFDVVFIIDGADDLFD